MHNTVAKRIKMYILITYGAAIESVIYFLLSITHVYTSGPRPPTARIACLPAVTLMQHNSVDSLYPLEKPRYIFLSHYIVSQEGCTERIDIQLIKWTWTSTTLVIMITIIWVRIDKRLRENSWCVLGMHRCVFQITYILWKRKCLIYLALEFCMVIQKYFYFI